MSILFAAKDERAMGITNQTSAFEIKKMWADENIYIDKPDKKSKALKKSQQKYYAADLFDEMEKTSDDINVGNLYDLSSGFYHYQGSKTTPPCSENNVEWIIQANPSYMTTSQLNILNKVIEYPGNARPIQKLYNRTVNYYSRTDKSGFELSLPSTLAPTDTFRAQPSSEVETAHCSSTSRRMLANSYSYRQTTDEENDAFFVCPENGRSRV